MVSWAQITEGIDPPAHWECTPAAVHDFLDRADDFEKTVTEELGSRWGAAAYDTDYRTGVTFEGPRISPKSPFFPDTPNWFAIDFFVRGADIDPDAPGVMPIGEDASQLGIRLTAYGAGVEDWEETRRPLLLSILEEHFSPDTPQASETNHVTQSGAH